MRPSESTSGVGSLIVEEPSSKSINNGGGDTSFSLTAADCERRPERMMRPAAGEEDASCFLTTRFTGFGPGVDEDGEQPRRRVLSFLYRVSISIRASGVLSKGWMAKLTRSGAKLQREASSRRYG